MVGAVLLSEIEETEFPKGTVLQSRDNDVIEDLDPQESTGADQIAGYSDVRIARLRISPGMVVLCEVRDYVTLVDVSSGTVRQTGTVRSPSLHITTAPTAMKGCRGFSAMSCLAFPASGATSPLIGEFGASSPSRSRHSRGSSRWMWHVPDILYIRLLRLESSEYTQPHGNIREPRTACKDTLIHQR